MASAEPTDSSICAQVALTASASVPQARAEASAVAPAPTRSETLADLVVDSEDIPVHSGRALLPPGYYNKIAPFMKDLTCRKITYNPCIGEAIGLAGALLPQVAFASMPADVAAIIPLYIKVAEDTAPNFVVLDLANENHLAIVQTVKAFGAWNALWQVLVRGSIVTAELTRAAQALLGMSLGSPDYPIEAFDSTIAEIGKLLVGTAFEGLDLVPPAEHVAANVNGQTRIVCELRGDGTNADTVCRVGPALRNKWGKPIPDQKADGFMVPVIGSGLAIYNALPTVEFGVRQPLIAMVTSPGPVRVAETARHNFIRAFSQFAQLALCTAHEMPGQEQSVYESLCGALRVELDGSIAHIASGFANGSLEWFLHYESMAKVYVACRALTSMICKTVWKAACMAAPVHLHPPCIEQHLTTVNHAAMPRLLFGASEISVAESAHAQLELARGKSAAAMGKETVDTFRVRQKKTTWRHLIPASTPLADIDGFTKVVAKLLGLEPNTSTGDMMECFGTLGGLYQNYCTLVSLNDAAVREPLISEFSDPVFMVRANQPPGARESVGASASTAEDGVAVADTSLVFDTAMAVTQSIQADMMRAFDAR